MVFNYHTHTIRCGHAQGKDREYVEAAIKAGYTTLGFADHAYFFPAQDLSWTQEQTERLFDYGESIRALAKEYEKDIRILLGFELEYYPDIHQTQMQFFKQIRPEYFILGQHDLTPHGQYLQNVPDHDTLNAYVTQVIAGLETGDFLYLAHPDLLGFGSGKTAYIQYRRLCEYAKKKGIPLEFNLLGFSTNRCYPSREFLQIAADIGNKIVLGVDAHTPQAFLDTQTKERALALIQELGLQLIDKPLL